MARRHGAECENHIKVSHSREAMELAMVRSKAASRVCCDADRVLYLDLLRNSDGGLGCGGTYVEYEHSSKLALVFCEYVYCLGEPNAWLRQVSAKRADEAMTWARCLGCYCAVIGYQEDENRPAPGHEDNEELSGARLFKSAIIQIRHPVRITLWLKDFEAWARAQVNMCADALKFRRANCLMAIEGLSGRPDDRLEMFCRQHYTPLFWAYMKGGEKSPPGHAFMARNINRCMEYISMNSDEIAAIGGSRLPNWPILEAAVADDREEQ